MNLWNEILENYLAQHSEAESQVLQELERQTFLKVPQPHMLSGKVQGRFLALISKLMQPKNILEIGTYTGYSALCLSEGLKSDGHLHTIDNNPELKTIAEKYWQKAEKNAQIILHQGNALDIIPTLDVIFDIAFIDADKEHYLEYYELILPKIRQGGIIIADNVLWKGKVLDNPEKHAKITKTLHAFNQFVTTDIRTEKVLLPLRDGLMFAYKK